MAVCDALAQAAGTTVAEFLTPDVARLVNVNATIGAASTAGAYQAALYARAAGFGCVKLKVGMARSLEEECERVAAVRDAIGSHMLLRLDANGAWEAEEAIRIIQTLEPYNLEFVEQPVRPGNLEAMKRVREAVRTPIAADEDVVDYDAACRVLQCAAAQVLVLKPMMLGGLRPARRIIELAYSAGVATVVTTTIDSGVGTAAALHLAATLPHGSPACGLATADLLAADLLVCPLPVRGGRMELPVSPGLGVELTQGILR
ncbi:MAG: mandelate racemase/muconate lactonizing enzyme family protein [Candidatus Binatia bacterium]